MLHIRKPFFTALLLVLAAAFCFAQSDIQLLKPDTVKDLDGTSTSAVIRTSMKKASVYINGEFLGLTPLTVNNLVPGTYQLMIKKTGREPKTFIIEIKRSLAQTYYIEL